MNQPGPFDRPEKKPVEADRLPVPVQMQLGRMVERPRATPSSSGLRKTGQLSRDRRR